MGPFVVLAAALALAATAVTVVVALHLLQRARRLAAAVGRAGERLAPLLEELRTEAAVTNVEADQLHRRTAARRGPPEG